MGKRGAGHGKAEDHASGPLTSASPPASGGARSRKKKEAVYKPNPVLDVILTILFAILTLATVRACWVDSEKRMTAVLCGSLVVVAVWAELSKVTFRWIGKTLSRVCYQAGMLDSDALNDPKKPERLEKWMTQSWQLAIHWTMTLVALAFLYVNPQWWTDPRAVWYRHTEEAEVGLALKSLYIFQQSIWIYTCFIHVALDHRRKDYFVMYIHHIVTLSLIVLSFTSQSHRVGFLVMFVHDISDIFIDSMKMSNYLGLGDAKAYYITEASYVATILSWAYFRLYEFPFRVIFAAFKALPETCPETWADISRMPFFMDGLIARFHNDCIPNVYNNITLLCILAVLHVWWFALLLNIGLSLASGTSTKEVSETSYEGNMDLEHDHEEEAAEHAKAD